MRVWTCKKRTQTLNLEKTGFGMVDQIVPKPVFAFSGQESCVAFGAILYTSDKTQNRTRHAENEVDQAHAPNIFIL